MTHKFVYFSDIEKPTTQSVVWWISIGESEREKRYLRIINSYAAVRQAWFEAYQESTLMRLILVEEEVFGSAFGIGLRFRSRKISAKDFVQLLKSGSLESAESSMTSNKTARLLHKMFDWQIIELQNKNQGKTILPSLPRKNLSRQQEDMLFRVIFASCLILASYLFAAILEAIERHVLLLS